VDFEATPPEADEPILREVFHFHPLAVDDALQESHVPKIDDWDDYLYIVLHAVTFDQTDGGHVDTLELDVFLGRNYMVTHHDQSIAAIEKVMQACQRDERLWKNGIDYILYRLTDEVVASYMPVVEGIDEAVDRAEDEVFGRPSPDVLEDIFTLKRLCCICAVSSARSARYSTGWLAMIIPSSTSGRGSTSAMSTTTWCACTTSPRASAIW